MSSQKSTKPAKAKPTKAEEAARVRAYRAANRAVRAKSAAGRTSAEIVATLDILEFHDFIAANNSLAEFCRRVGVPERLLHEWLDDPAHPERRAYYIQAKERRADNVFESLDEVSEQAVEANDPTKIQGLRLKSDNMKWKLARMHKKYSDRTVVSGDPEAPFGAPQRPDLSKLTLEELQTLTALQRKLEGS